MTSPSGQFSHDVPNLRSSLLETRVTSLPTMLTQVPMWMPGRNFRRMCWLKYVSHTIHGWLVYLPTFTIEINQLYRWTYHTWKAFPQLPFTQKFIQQVPEKDWSRKWISRNQLEEHIPPKPDSWKKTSRIENSAGLNPEICVKLHLWGSQL